MFIGDYLARRELYTPNRLAVVDAGKSPALRLTYAQMNARADSLAYWLHENGVGLGNRVAILARDGVEHLDLFFACGKIGAIHTALNWRLHWRELADILADTIPKILFYSAEFEATIEQLQGAGLTSVAAWMAVEEMPVAGERLSVIGEQSAVDEETIAALIFTGGTTGRPKAAQISHRMIAWNTLNTVIHDLHHDDIYLNVFPLFHTGGLFVYTLPQIILGGTIILTRQFEPVQVLNLIEQEGVTVFAGVPTMYQMLTQATNWETAVLSSLRFCTSGGAPLPVPLVRQFRDAKGVRFKQGFGMTEFGPGIFALAAEDAIEKAGSIGRPNFYVAARVVDDDNQPLGPNQVGELVLKGPSASSGYFNNPEATAEARDAEGWFHTGDLAQYDEDGYFYIVDRKKDMFISGGENIYPAEIERVLYGHTAVHMCAVVGIPDEKWGEIGVACVVPKPDAADDEAALIEALDQHLRDHLAPYKVPRHIRLFKELPISGAGKILKRDLKDEVQKI
jgi:fatty-acyl-CoA synthase